jgi:hypothetical protein
MAVTFSAAMLGPVRATRLAGLWLELAVVDNWFIYISREPTPVSYVRTAGELTDIALSTLESSARTASMQYNAEKCGPRRDTGL